MRRGQALLAMLPSRLALLGIACVSGSALRKQCRLR